MSATTPPDPFEGLCQLQRWLHHYFPHAHPEEVVVRVTVHGVRREMTLMFPSPAPPPGAPPPAAPPPAAGGDGASESDPMLGVNDCGRDILTLLEEVGRRLTGEQIRREFQARQKVHGDSTISHALADLGPLHRALLSNRRDSYGRGYGLADWE